MRVTSGQDAGCADASDSPGDYACDREVADGKSVGKGD